MFEDKPYLMLKTALQNYSGIDVPVASTLMVDGVFVEDVFFNQVYKEKNHLLHSEIISINDGLNKLKVADFKNHNVTLYSSLEPCCMCLAYACYTRVKKIIYYAKEPKFGGVERIFTLNSAFFKPEIIFIEKDEISNILKTFFQKLRN